MNSKTNTVRAILLDATECERPETDHPATIEICADDLQRILERHITEPAQCLHQIAEPLQAVQPAVPEGWKLVPMEPLDMQQVAGAQAIRFDTTVINKMWTANKVYREMVAATPAHPAEGVPAAKTDMALSRACDLLSMAIVTLMGFRETVGYTDNSPIAGLVNDAVEFLQPWPEKRPTTTQPAAHQFQVRVGQWLMECFGHEIAHDGMERNHRFFEEALELVQSLGCTASEAHQLVDYVYGRPVGEPVQELGGVMVTLAALCFAHQMDMAAGAEKELARICDPATMAKIKAKQATKPCHSPLPQLAATQPAAQGRDLQAVINAAADKLDAAKRCHPNAVETLVDEALELLDGDRKPAAQGLDAQDDTVMLNILQTEKWDLRCFDVPTGAGDSEVHWKVTAAPHEREVGRACSDDPRDAIRSAIGNATNIAAQAKQGGEA